MAVEIRPKQSSLAVKIERNDHNTLTHRNEPNQHTIEAVTGLAEALTNLNNLIIDLQTTLGLNDPEAQSALERLAINLTELINAEKDRAVVEEDKLKTDIANLNTEISAKADEFQQTVGELTNEINKATLKDSELAKQIVDECNRSQEVEERLLNSISGEVIRAEGVEIALRKDINNLDIKVREKADLINGKVPNSQLPESHRVCNIIEEDNVDKFPAVGTAGNLYISTSTSTIYRWDGTSYVEISSAKFNADTVLNITCSLD